MVGMLRGLIPQSIRRKRERPNLGWAGFVAGLLHGLIGGLPPQQPERHAKGIPTIRTPVPDPYVL